MEVQKIVPFAIALYFAMPMLGCGVLAIPQINNLSISPANPWLGDNVRMDINCSDGANRTITRAYANVSGQGISFSLDLAASGGGMYGASIASGYLTKTGLYSVNAGCINNASEQGTKSGSFTVSRLAAAIGSITDVSYPDQQAVVYSGDDFDAYLLVKKDGNPLASGLEFRAKLNNEQKTIQQPIPFFQGSGHRLRMAAPANPGEYTLELKATYQGRDVINSTKFTVRNIMTLELLSIDKSSLSGPDEIKLRLRATERGSALSINEEDLSIELDSEDAEISSIAQDGSAYNVEITAPDLSPGTYTLEIKFTRGGYSSTVTRQIEYTIPISGQISWNGKGIAANIELVGDNGAKKVFSTDSSGAYSGAISPGIYEVTLKHSEAKITFSDVDIDEFDDPIRYYYDSDRVIDGIETAGLFFFEAAFDFSDAYMELQYDDRKVEGPESELGVYKCSEWTGDSCHSKWIEVPATIDTVRNMAKLTVSSLSAFVVGTIENLQVDARMDKSSYHMGENISIEGIVSDAYGNSVAGASVSAVIKGTAKAKTVQTNDEGVFSITLAADAEGQYTAEITASKPPYNQSKAAKAFLVSKSKGISIDSESGVKIESGKNKTVEFTVKNTGQAVLKSVSLSISNVPAAVTAVLNTDRLGDMEPLGQAVLSVDFRSNNPNSSGTYPVVIRAESGDGTFAERTMAITLERRAGVASQQAPATGVSLQPDAGLSIIGNFIAGIGAGAGALAVYIAAIFAGSVSFAFAMRKRRISRSSERAWVKNMLSSIGQEINRSNEVSGDVSAKAGRRTRKKAIKRGKAVK